MMIKGLLLAFLICFALTYGSVMALNYLAENGCYERSVSFDDSRWTFTSGCMVKIEGKWLPLGIVRDFNNPS